MSDWFIDDYRPTKRVGLEQLEGCISILERRADEKALSGEETTPADWMDEGALLALRMVLSGRFHYPQDFVAVFDARRAEIFGWEDEKC